MNQEQIEAGARALASKQGYRYDGLSIADKKWYAEAVAAVLAAVHPTLSTVEEYRDLPAVTRVVYADRPPEDAQVYYATATTADPLNTESKS